MKGVFISGLCAAFLVAELRVQAVNNVALRPTLAAPVAATGTVQVQGSSSLSIETESLAPGTYRVTGVARQDGSTVLLGLISIRDPSTGPERQAGDSHNRDDSTHQSHLLLSRCEIQLPRGITIKDLLRIVVTDLSGNHLLVAIL